MIFCLFNETKNEKLRFRASRPAECLHITPGCFRFYRISTSPKHHLQRVHNTPKSRKRRKQKAIAARSSIGSLFSRPWGEISNPSGCKRFESFAAISTVFGVQRSCCVSSPFSTFRKARESPTSSSSSSIFKSNSSCKNVAKLQAERRMLKIWEAA